MKRSNELFAFESNEMIVMLDDNDDPWWIAADVCNILGLTNVSEALRAIPDEERLVSEILRAGQKRAVNLINEPALYRLVARSNKPVAIKFQNWIFTEVLPSIRKTGSYSADQLAEYEALKTNQGIYALLEIAQEKLKLDVKVTELENDINTMSVAMEADKPKVEYHDAVVASKGWQRLWDFGKASELGCRDIFKYCRGYGFIYKNGDNVNQPYQKYIDCGWFQFKNYVKQGQEYSKVYVSGKGKSAILREFNKRKQLLFPEIGKV